MDRPRDVADGITNRMRPAVIVGLGGTGKEVVALIREYLIDQYGSLDRLPIVSFLVIDTDPAPPEVEQRSANAREVRLNPDELVVASIPDIATIWRERDNLPHLRDWLPSNLDGIGDIAQGAKQIRALGRLAFFDNFNEIRRAIRGARDKVINPDHAMRVGELGIEIDPSFQSDPEYYLISSLAGGTGAGMFLDTAFLIKSLDHAREESPVIAFLALPDVFEDHSVGRVNPNAYAALTELNYFTYNAHDRETGDYVDPRYEGNNPWHVQYVEGGTPVEVAPPPFRYCYLLGMENDEGTVKFTAETRTDFFEMLAHNIVLDFTSAFGAYKRSARDNPGEGFLEPDERGMPQSFCSFGLSSLRFPRRAVLNACAARLCRNVALLWQGKLSGPPSEHAIDSAVAQFMEGDLRLARADGRDALQRMAGWLSGADEGISLFGMIDAWRRGVSDRIVRERPSADRLRSMLLAATDELTENLFDDGSADASKWGKWLREMQGNAERQLGTARSRMDDKINELLDAHYGPTAIQAFLDDVTARLEALRSGLDRQLKDDSQLSSETEQAQRATRTRLQRLDAIASTFVFDKPLVLAVEAEDYLDSAVRAKKAQLGQKAADLGARLVSGILQHAGRLKGELAELDALLADIEARFKTSYEDWAARASSQMVNGISLYERADTIDDCYAKDVPPEHEVATAQRLSTQTLTDLSSRLFDLVRAPKVDIRQRMFRLAAAQYFPNLENVSAAEILADKPVAQQERLLRSVHDRSSPFIHLVRNTPGFYAGQIVRNRFVGILGGDESADRHVQALLPVVRELPGVRGNIYPLPDSAKDEILIGQELYTYPLRAIGTMEDLQADYIRYMAKARALPIHVHRRWEEELPDPIPVPPDVERQSRITAAIGLALDLIRSDDAQQAWICEYVGDAGLLETVTLTREHDFSLLWRRIAEDTDVRRHLTDRMEELVRESRGPGRDLHRELSDYLNQLSERHPRTTRAYQEQFEVIREFITSHDLAQSE